jgi:hypothetical protein
VDGRRCADQRTSGERWEDEELERVEKGARDVKIIMRVFFGVLGLALLLALACPCGDERRGVGAVANKREGDEGTRDGVRRWREEQVECLDRASEAADSQDAIERVDPDEVPSTDLDIEDDESLPKYIE